MLTTIKSTMATKKNASKILRFTGCFLIIKICWNSFLFLHGMTL